MFGASKSTASPGDSGRSSRNSTHTSQRSNYALSRNASVSIRDTSKSNAVRQQELEAMLNKPKNAVSDVDAIVLSAGDVRPDAPPDSAGAFSKPSGGMKRGGSKRVPRPTQYRNGQLDR